MKALAILKNKKGQSLLIAVCLMLIFVALSFAVLLSATQLTAGKQLDLYREQARIGAVTLMKKVESELSYTDAADPGARSSMQQYLFDSMSVFEGISDATGSKWQYYDASDAYQPLLVRSFTLKDALDDGMRIDSASIDMYWTADSAIMRNDENDIEKKCQSTRLIVTVNCTSEGETYSIQQAFDTVFTEGVDDFAPSLHWAYKEAEE